MHQRISINSLFSIPLFSSLHQTWISNYNRCLIKLRNDNFAFVRVLFRLIPVKIAASLILRPTFRFERLFVRDNFFFFKYPAPNYPCNALSKKVISLCRREKFSKTTTLPSIAAQQGNQNIYHSHVTFRNCARRRVYRHFSTKENLSIVRGP